ncbi:MAG TPA: copper chaperone PCu(A)C [Acidimicrobiales bacterium]
MKRKTWEVAITAVVAVVVTTSVVALTQHSPRASERERTPSSLKISDVTVTATSSQGDSAVVMSLVNATGGPISLISVSSPRAAMSMMFYDVNMRQAHSAMTWLPDIVIGSAKTQLLGYQNQGVMLSLLHAKLKIGARVPLEIKYSNFSTSRTVVVDARVVAPPMGLHFNTPAMNM